MINHEEIRRAILDDRCAGRVLVIGTAGSTYELVSALTRSSRVSSVVVIEPDWNRARKFIYDFKNADSSGQGNVSVEVKTDEYDVALRPPVEQYDLAFVCVPYGNLQSFVEEVVPFMHLLSNRGWVSHAHCVVAAGITKVRTELMAFVDMKMDDAVEDLTLLDHLATENTNDPIKLACQPFFALVRGKINDGGLDLVRERLNDWIVCFASVAFEPGAMSRLESWIEYDLSR